MQLIRIGSKIPRKIGCSTTEKLSEPLETGGKGLLSDSILLPHAIILQLD
jgi:hypothetical protein